MNVYNDIVLGAGINGLITATRLGMSGRRVLLIERAAVAGGRAAAHEFHPGFHSPGLLSDTSAIRPALFRELGLARFGLVPEQAAQECVTVGLGGVITDPQETSSPWHAWVGEVAPVIESFLDDSPLDLLHPERMELKKLLQRGFDLRRLGKQRMMELLRVPPMPLADWLRESFTDERVMAALAHPALIGSWLAPRSPGSSFNLLLDRIARTTPVRGGTPALVSALVAAAAAAGVTLRLNTEIARLHHEDRSIVGVVLRDGETISSERVAVATNPREAMLELVPAQLVPHRQRRRYEAYRCRGTTAQLLIALDREPSPLAEHAFAQTAETLDEIERAFDAVKYRRFSETPALWMHLASRAAPQLAPAGKAVLSVLIQFAPYALDGGWNEASRAQLFEATQRVLEDRLPGIGATVLGHELLDPTNLEQRYGLPGGQIHHGEQALDQWLVRPEPDAALYRTALEGLWFCGAGSHPGGALSGAPGRLAAQALLAD